MCYDTNILKIHPNGMATFKKKKKSNKERKKERRRKLVIDFYRCCAKKINVEKVEKETRPEPSKIIFELVPSTESRALSGKT